MAILNRDEFFTALHNRVGSDSSEESIEFLENMTDTFNDLERRASGDGVNWEQKCKEIDEAWKQRYRHRFLNGSGGVPNTIPKSDPDEKDPEDVTISDLFK